MIHQSATTLNLLPGEGNYIDWLIKVAPVKGWGYIREQMNSQLLRRWKQNKRASRRKEVN